MLFSETKGMLGTTGLWRITAGPFANCFGAPCLINGDTVTCTCPVDNSTYIAPEPPCVLSGQIWSATSTSSFPDIESSIGLVNV